MSKSREYVKGFVDALKMYAWLDNKKLLRVGIPGVLLTEAVSNIEREMEQVPAAVEPKPERSHDKRPH